jgi:thiamine biosynthesis lipoprotein
VSLWRAARKSGKLSSPEEVQSARERVDWRRVELDEAHRTVTLRGQGMQLDLGGIAKGYAAAAAVRKLRSRGFPRSLVALAGDIAVGDAPPGEEGWKIDVLPPTFAGDDVTRLMGGVIRTSLILVQPCP